MKLGRHAVSLLLVIGAAGAAVWAYLDSKSVTEQERKMRPTNVFVPWRKEDLSRVELVHGAEKLVLARDPQGDGGELGWRITSPRDDRPDPSAVDRLLGTLEFATIVRKVEGGGAGFDPPRATGAIQMGPITHTFALGGPAPTPEGASYLRVGDQVVVVSRDVTNELLKTADAYRERTIVPYLSIELARMEIRGPKGTVSLERADEISFLLGQGGVRASRERLDKVWGALAETRAESFLPDAAGEPALAKPAVTVTMFPKDAARPIGELVVGGPCPSQPEGVIVVRTKPSRATACAARVILEGLSPSREALVDTRPFAAHVDEIAEIELHASPSGEQLELARSGSGWHERAPADRALTQEESEALHALLSSIVATEGTSPRREPELSALSSRIRLKREDGVEEVLDVGPVTDDAAQIRRRADGVVLTIDRSAWRRLRPRATSLRGPEVWKTPLSGRSVSRLATTCAATPQEVRFDGSKWTMTKPAGYAADPASAQSLIDAVTRLRAETWVADEDDGHFGLAASTPQGKVEMGCSVELDAVVDGGARTFTLRLGAMLGMDKGRYAQASADPAVFVAPASFTNLLTKLLVDRHGFAVERAGVRRVTIASRGGPTVTLRSDAGKLQGANAEEVLSALEQLFADRVESLGPADVSRGLAPPALTIEVETDTGKRRILVGLAINGGKERFARLEGVDANFLIESKRLEPFFAASK